MKWTAAILIGITLSSCGNSTTSSNSSTDSTSMKNYAYVISTNFVKDYLKSPTSAVFDNFTASPYVNLVGGVYTVVYHFDADNSFGAKTRSQYTCDLTYKGGSPESKNNWELKALQIDGNTLVGSFSVASHKVESNIKKAANGALSALYNVEKTDGNGYYLKIYIYLKDKQKINEINQEICDNFDGKYSVSMSVWYFDKKNFVDKYLASIDNPNISDAAFNSLDKHLIATYEKNVGQDGDMEMNH